MEMYTVDSVSTFVLAHALPLISQSSSAEIEMYIHACKPMEEPNTVVLLHPMFASLLLY